MQKCEYRDDCLPLRFPGCEIKVCPVEAANAVATCRHHQPMPCGHPRLYQYTNTTYLRSDAMGGQEQGPLVTRWCAKCEEEAANADAEAEELVREERRRLERQADTERWEAEHADK